MRQDMPDTREEPAIIDVRKRLVMCRPFPYRQGMTNEERAWQEARRTRDPRFDGRFFVGVTSTGIYCRPICPAPSPREKNVRYFPTAAAAADAGLRPCLRCHPEVAPGTPAWQGTPATVQRALRLIDEHTQDGLRIDDLASRLGIGPRHLHRLFVQHLGAPPHVVVQTRRLHFAKQLVDRTRLPFAGIALAAGFGSIRRFNAAVRQAWGRTPTELRRTGAGRSIHDGAAYRFHLGYRPPYDWSALCAFLERRAVPGVERVADGRYVRAIEVGQGTALIEVSHVEPAHALDVTVHTDDPPSLYRIVARVRDLFDVDADPAAVRAVLALDRLLARSVRRRPGLRVPGAFDGFEIAVRAILGQQCSVAAARTLSGRMVAAYGHELAGNSAWRTFPRAEVLADAPMERLGMPRQRAAAIRALAAAVARGTLALARDADTASVRAALHELPGVGPWTVEYIAMRALGDPDAFVAGDLIVGRAAGLNRRALVARSEAWRPWRAYAVMHLWMGASDVQHASTHDLRQPARSAAARVRRLGAARAALQPSALAG
jgi:AraC family transcriptional regulator of adaptative response / DNA-3-methyladenine glycosylase II